MTPSYDVRIWCNYCPYSAILRLATVEQVADVFAQHQAGHEAADHQEAPSP